jgi:hypothetical protein
VSDDLWRDEEGVLGRLTTALSGALMERDIWQANCAAALKERDAYAAMVDQAKATIALTNATVTFLRKERDAAQAALKAAESLLQLAAGTQSELTRERDEARADLAIEKEDRHEQFLIWQEANADLDRLRAALEPTAENLDAYAVATSGNVIEQQDWEIQARNEARRLKRITDLLAAIRKKAGI